jgi:hypothetical protein
VDPYDGDPRPERDTARWDLLGREEHLWGDLDRYAEERLDRWLRGDLMGGL